MTKEEFIKEYQTRLVGVIVTHRMIIDRVDKKLKPSSAEVYDVVEWITDLPEKVRNLLIGMYDELVPVPLTQPPALPPQTNHRPPPLPTPRKT